MLKRGNVVFYMSNVFVEGPFADFVRSVRNEFRQDVLNAVGSRGYDPKEGYDPGYFVIEFIQRVLWRILDAEHGGTILIIPNDWGPNDSRFLDRVRVKYELNDDRTWTLLVESLTTLHKYYQLRPYDRKSISIKEHREITALRYKCEDVEDLVRDRAALIASLSSVDGAVVLNKRLRIFGFGAEIIAQSQALNEILMPTPPEGREVIRRPIDDFGTRHRSALRFCSSHEDVAAFVVSQDGDVRVAMRSGPDVLLWSGVDLSYFAT